ncbi:MAG TPA: NUDIX hydrolase [Thermoanaerobaculia bacterium]|nr:NUDIX hydrolase [Thermoanaerobaculia bacterium]
MAKRKFCYNYPRPAVTADIALFRGSGDDLEILLIQRKKDPYEGLWALPGGFVNDNEKLEDGAARELQEETSLRARKLEQFGAFGDPGRDPRGHTVSIGFMSEVRGKGNGTAGDDAAGLRWFAAGRLPKLAFDHKRVIQQALRAWKARSN